MALTELRNKQNTWFQKQNHVRPAKNQASKQYIDPTLGTALSPYGEPFAEFDMTIAYNGVSDQYGYDDRVPMGSVNPVEILPGNNIRYFVVAGDDRVYFKTVDLVGTATDVILGITFSNPAGTVSSMSMSATWNGSIYFVDTASVFVGMYDVFAENLGRTCTIKMYDAT